MKELLNYVSGNLGGGVNGSALQRLRGRSLRIGVR
ncbi:hypothetical protein SBA3_250030 [Candidatus Sulfopaludibacter sp. SbA3]|nr:hypothetical protein SBA3_250030 [Candidatus Sulfopaludibacter sp. SbA3]